MKIKIDKLATLKLVQYDKITMKELLEFLIKNITGSEDFAIDEVEEDGRIVLNVSADSGIVGLIIGKEGKTIKNLRKILSIRATKQNLGVNINVGSR